jgi:hypothetical protein
LQPGDNHKRLQKSPLTKKIQQARAELATTKTKLAEAYAEIEKLRARVNDRSLSIDDRQKIIAALKNAPKGTVIVKSNWIDGEADQFAKEIKEVLRDAGFSILDVNCEVLSLTIKGEFLIVASPEHAPAHAMPIIEAFKSVGIVLGIGKATPDMRKLRNGDLDQPRELRDDEIMIWISRKP